MKLVYIVITTALGNDFRYHIDSVWTSFKKAKKRCNKLNSDDLKEWREDYGYFLFDIETEPLRSKEFSEISEE